ncbi:MAG: sigma-70 family RNA polymerase sigma factor [Planctomycetes bacterium]|nr:sigma-70 family RNA polymerase sigma factor [Planctomycetota bacterium]
MNNPTNEVTAQALLEQSEWMRTLARALVRDSGAAEDLVQDTWLAALRGKPDAARDLRPWLGRVMRNFARERFRSRRRGEAREEDVARRGRELPGPSELAERVELQQLVVRIVMELPQALRTTVLLCYFEGLEPSEIARRTGEPAGTVRWRLKQGLDRVREELDRRHGGDRASWQLALAPLALGPRESAAGVGAGLVWIAAAILGLSVAAYWFTRPSDEDSLARAAVPATAQVELVEATPGDTRRAAVGESDAAPSAMSRAKQQRSWLSGVQEFFSGPLTRVQVRFVDELDQPVAGVQFRAGANGVVLSATSDRAGVAELETRALPDTRHIDFVGVDAQGRRWSHAETLAAGEDLDLGRVRLSAGARVRGRVTWPDARPAAGVEVVVDRDAQGIPQFQAALHGPLATEFWRRTASDADGRFELVGLPPGRASVWADGGELQWSWSESLELDPSAPALHVELRLRKLERPAPIVVDVRDEAGRTVETLLVRMSGPHGAARSGWSDGRLSVDDPERFGELGELWVADRTLRLGAARVEHLAPRAEPYELVLGAPLRFALEVVDGEGRSIANATADVRTLDGNFALPPQPLDTSAAAVVVLPGEFALTLSAPGHSVVRLGPLTHIANAAPLRVVLERLQSFEGRVLGPTGPLARANVSVTHARSEGELTLYQGAPCLLDLDRSETTRTDAEGKFAVTLRETGIWYVECEADGFAPHLFGPFDFDPRVATAPLELRVGHSGRIEGIAQLDDGRPAAQRVIGLSRGDHDVRTTRTDARGRFAFDVVAAGSWHVYEAEALLNESSSMSESYRGELALGWRHPSNCDVRAGETTQAKLLVESRELRELELSVRIDGRPAQRRSARLLPVRTDPFDARPFGEEALLDAQGAARVGYRGPGLWRLWVGLDALLLWEGDPSSRSTPLSLELSTGTLTGSVAQREQGEQLAAVWRLEDGWIAWRSLELDSQGSFRVERAPVGRGAIVRGHLPASLSSTWRVESLAEFEITAGATCVVDAR